MPIDLFRLLLDLLATQRLSERQKDLEILLLRQMVHSAVLRILQRKQDRQAQPIRISRWDKSILAVLAVRLKASTKRMGQGTGQSTSSRLDEVMLLFKPDTAFKWHRALVRRKWTHQRERPTARPHLVPELEEIIVRLARENPRWGYSKIQVELLKIGYTVRCYSVRSALKREHIPHASRRRKEHGSNWRTFLGHFANQMLACDFFTVETIRLQTLYVLFFIQFGTRRAWGACAGCTAHPTSQWVTQQARNLAWDLWDTRELENKESPIRFLIHDRDAKFTPSFNAVLASEGIESVLTPYRVPKANAFAERWVLSVREECLDHLLIISEAHLSRVLSEYVNYYNERRPYQDLGQQMPVVVALPELPGLLQDGDPTRAGIHRRDVLGGIIHDYQRQHSLGV